MEIRLGRFLLLFAFLLGVVSLTLFFVCNYSAEAKPPETAKIVYASFQGGNLDVYIMNPDGSEQIRLTQHPAEDRQPTWSPTGAQILFVSDRQDSVPDLFFMDADGKNIHKVFEHTDHRTRPTYSPDGKRIAYLKDNERAIYTATVKEQEEERLVQVGTSNGEPIGVNLRKICIFLGCKKMLRSGNTSCIM